MKNIVITLLYLLYNLTVVFGLIYVTQYLGCSNWLWLCVILLGVNLKYN